MDETYGAASVPYCDTVACHLSGLSIQLAKAGHIKTTNNGYNCYTYHFLKD